MTAAYDGRGASVVWRRDGHTWERRTTSAVQRHTERERERDRERRCCPLMQPPANRADVGWTLDLYVRSGSTRPLPPPAKGPSPQPTTASVRRALQRPTLYACCMHRHSALHSAAHSGDSPTGDQIYRRIDTTADRRLISMRHSTPHRSRQPSPLPCFIEQAAVPPINSV